MAAATLASVALLGATAEPAREAATTDMPHGRLVLGLHPPERVAVLDVATGALERAPPAGRHALPRPADGVRLRALLPKPGERYLHVARRPGAFWALRVRPGHARASVVREISGAGRTLLPLSPAAAGRLSERRDGGRHRPREPRPRADLGPAQRRAPPAPGAWMVAASAEHAAPGAAAAAGGSASGRRLRERHARGWSFRPGAARSLPTGPCSRWPPTRRRRTRIALVRTADGAVELLPAPLPATRGELAWSRSGEWLYVAAREPHGSPPTGRATGAS